MLKARSRVTGIAALLVVAGTASAGAPLTTLNLGPLTWQTRNGQTLPAVHINTEFWETDAGETFSDGLVSLGRFRTGFNGRALMNTNYDDGIFNDYLEVYEETRAEIPGVAQVKAANGNANPYTRPVNPTSPWFVEENGHLNALTLPVNNSTVFGRSIGILQFMGHMNRYYTNNTGHNLTIPMIDVVYTNTTSGSFLAGDGSHIQIDNAYSGTSDIIMHEYGHHVAGSLSMDSSPGGSHTFFTDNIRSQRPNATPAAGNTAGAALAWSEGIASYLAISAIRDGNMSGTIGGLPGQDYDTRYTDLPQNFDVDLETINWRSGNNNLQNRGVGEGDEASVGRILWDLNDNTPGEGFGAGRGDRINFGAQTTMSHILRGTDNAGNESLREMWADLTAVMGTVTGKTAAGLGAGATQDQAVATVGELLTQYAVAASPTTNGAQPATPTLRWNEQNNDNSNLYRVLVFDGAWNVVADSGAAAANLIADPNFVAAPVPGPGAPASAAVTLDAMSWTVPGAQALDPGQYRYVVLSNPAGVTAANLGSKYNFYWSHAQPFRVVPSPGAISLLMLSGIATLRRRR